VSDIREFRVPDLGEGLEDAEIVTWHVEVGDTIELNQDVCDVETAKALVAVPSPFAGKVVERFGEVGETVDVGSPLLRIDVSTTSDTGAATPADEVEGKEEEPAKRQSVLVGYGAEQGATRRRRRATSVDGGAETRPKQPSGGAPVLAKPPVRKLAKDLDVDLGALAPGTGPEGTITRDDVYAAKGETPTTALPSRPSVSPAPDGLRPGDRIPLRGIRGRIAEKMVTSRSEIPEATTSITIDCTELVATAKRLTQAAESDGAPIKVTPLALILKATALALRRYPEVNARLDREAQEIVLLEDLNLGVASDTARGLIVPVIKHADGRSILELSQELLRLVEAARSGSIRPDDLTGGTFTVNNYGALGAEDGEPVINHPEAAILGIGAIKDRPWVVDGQLAVRKVGRLTLSFDHRIFDGGTAARFITHLGAALEDPTRLLLYS
jgi:2-oxoisovalerate dehydrogenase E2 component (dihydrolipoyl transacylase)